MLIDEIIRSKRKTIALIVERDGRLVVRAPQRASEAQIQKFVRQKISWIQSKKAQAASNPLPPPKRYQTGEMFYYLGESYPLRIVGRQAKPLVFDGDFRLRKSDLEQAEARFTAWYRAEARRITGERLAIFAPMGGFKYRSVRITSARGRWGSCGARGTLNFTWRLVMAPLVMIDYVVVHELAHLKQRGHQKAFWDSVAALLPDYMERRRWLKEHGERFMV